MPRTVLNTARSRSLAGRRGSDSPEETGDTDTDRLAWGNRAYPPEHRSFWDRSTAGYTLPVDTREYNKAAGSWVLDNRFPEDMKDRTADTRVGDSKSMGNTEASVGSREVQSSAAGGTQAGKTATNRMV